MKALQGIRVLDLSWLLPGPYATMLLADLGADVVKIEQPGKGDYTRAVHPDMFQVANRNKRSLTLNLKSPAGKKVLLRLVETADVLVEGFRAGVMGRLGLDYETLSKINPRLIYCSISGYGQTGPYREWAGHDIGYAGVGGAMAVPSDLKYPPIKASLPIGDLSSGMYATIAIQAAIMERQHSGLGQYLDIGIADCVAAWTGTRPLAHYLYFGEMPPTKLNATSRVYHCKDGKRIALAVTEDHFWANLCKALGRADWAADPRFVTLDGRRAHNDVLLPQLEEILMQRARDEWLAIFAADDVPAAPVHDPLDVFEDPQLKHRKLLWEWDDDEGKHRRIFGWPVKFSREAPALRNPAPVLGNATDAVLAEAGYAPADIAALRVEGAL